MVHPVMQRAYRAADYVQWQYFRHAARIVAVVMAACCSSTMKMIVKMIWVTLKITCKVFVVMVMVGFGIMFTFLSFAMGGGKLAKTLSGGSGS
jgi:hypothetical protein